MKIGRKKVAVGLSGGVDSSVTAAIMKDQGFDVIGITMKIWNEDSPLQEEGPKHGCYGPGEKEDIEDASKVCDILGIPYFVFDLHKEYDEIVLKYFSREYSSGRTPNPCVVCNRHLKFELLLEAALAQNIEFDYFATGHYARIIFNQNKNRHLLLKGLDAKKDQSYFLYGLNQEQLSRSLFPLGEFQKEEVRKMAREFNLPLHDKKESQNFISGSYTTILSPRTKLGAIKNIDGEILGSHRGIENYTVGQRKGLGLSSSDPLYVVKIDNKDNSIIVGNRSNVYNDRLTASGLNWISMECLGEAVSLKARIRYASREEPAMVYPLDDNRIRVQFEKPQLAITPGQSIVFYSNEEVIGGGVID